MIMIYNIYVYRYTYIYTPWESNTFILNSQHGLWLIMRKPFKKKSVCLFLTQKLLKVFGSLGIY
jgi:hypothetical protein